MGAVFMILNAALRQARLAASGKPAQMDVFKCPNDGISCDRMTMELDRFRALVDGLAKGKTNLTFYTHEGCQFSNCDRYRTR